MPAAEQDAWLLHSVEVAFGCGASVVSLIPTRGGNGAMDALSADGSFREPRLDDVERSVELAHARASSGQRLFVDLWNLERFSDCPACFGARRDRLHTINLEQRIPPPIVCEHHER